MANIYVQFASLITISIRDRAVADSESGVGTGWRASSKAPADHRG